MTAYSTLEKGVLSFVLIFRHAAENSRTGCFLRFFLLNCLTSPLRIVSVNQKVSNPTELTPELVNEFIQKIVVSSPRYLDGKRYQMIEIHYKGVGIINIQTPDEFEMDFQAHMKQRRQKSA